MYKVIGIYYKVSGVSEFFLNTIIKLVTVYLLYNSFLSSRPRNDTSVSIYNKTHSKKTKLFRYCDAQKILKILNSSYILFCICSACGKFIL